MALTTPDQPTVVPGAGEAVVTWNVTVDNPPTYIVGVYDPPGAGGPTATHSVAINNAENGDGTASVVIPLDPGHSYAFAVRADDGTPADLSAYSAKSATTTSGGREFVSLGVSPASRREPKQARPKRPRSTSADHAGGRVVFEDTFDNRTSVGLVDAASDGQFWVVPEDYAAGPVVIGGGVLAAVSPNGFDCLAGSSAPRDGRIEVRIKNQGGDLFVRIAPRTVWHHETGYGARMIWTYDQTSGGQIAMNTVDGDGHGILKLDAYDWIDSDWYLLTVYFSDGRFGFTLVHEATGGVVARMNFDGDYSEWPEWPVEVWVSHRISLPGDATATLDYVRIVDTTPPHQFSDRHLGD